MISTTRSDAITAAICKAGWRPMAETLIELFHCVWRKAQEFLVTFIIHLYTRKGNPKVCFNHRGNFIDHCWYDTGKYPSESFEWRSDWSSTRKSVWFQEGQRNSSYDLYSKTIPREMPKHGLLHDICGPHQIKGTNRSGRWANTSNNASTERKCRSRGPMV